jgi:hypothetical protein
MEAGRADVGMAGFSWIGAIGTLKNPYHTGKSGTLNACRVRQSGEWYGFRDHIAEHAGSGPGVQRGRARFV